MKFFYKQFLARLLKIVAYILLLDKEHVNRVKVDIPTCQQASSSPDDVK